MGKKNIALLLLFNLLFLSCSTSSFLNYRSLANVEGIKYSCDNLIFSIMIGKDIPSISIVDVPTGANRYFTQKLLPQATSMAYIEKTAKSSAFINFLRKTRVKKSNGVSFNLSEKEFLGRFKNEHPYTFIIMDNQLIFSETGPQKFVDLLSKHIQLSNKRPVQFAGELFIKDDVLHITNASGTYMPSGELLINAKQFFEDNFKLSLVKTIDVSKLKAPLDIQMFDQ